MLTGKLSGVEAGLLQRSGAEQSAPALLVPQGQISAARQCPQQKMAGYQTRFALKKSTVRVQARSAAALSWRGGQGAGRA